MCRCLRHPSPGRPPPPAVPLLSFKISRYESLQAQASMDTKGRWAGVGPRTCPRPPPLSPSTAEFQPLATLSATHLISRLAARVSPSSNGCFTPSGSRGAGRGGPWWHVGACWAAGGQELDGHAGRGSSADQIQPSAPALSVCCGPFSSCRKVGGRAQPARHHRAGIQVHRRWRLLAATLLPPGPLPCLGSHQGAVQASWGQATA